MVYQRRRKKNPVQASLWLDDKYLDLVCNSDENPSLDHVPFKDQWLDQARS